MSFPRAAGKLANKLVVKPLKIIFTDRLGYSGHLNNRHGPWVTHEKYCKKCGAVVAAVL
jgi:hypothetical protein